MATLGNFQNFLTTYTSSSSATVDWRHAYQQQLQQLQQQAQPVAPPSNDPRDWLRRRVREITDLAPKGA